MHSGFLASAAAVSVLFIASASAGQTAPAVALYLKNNDQGVVRGPSYDPVYLRLNWFNRQNCLDDESVRFYIDVRGSAAAVAGYHLDAWVGAVCDQAENRDSVQCKKVGEASAELEQVDLRVRDLVAPLDVPVPADEADSCDYSGDYQTPRDRTLYFMLLDADGQSPATGPALAKWAFNYDLVGPPPPVSVAVTPAAGALHLSWELSPNAPIDLKQYILLCDPPPPSEPVEDGDFTPYPNELCISTALGPGELPDDALIGQHSCGLVQSNSPSGETTLGAETTPLSTSVEYAVGVASRDMYYNVGPVSDNACGTPAPPAPPRSDLVITHGGCGCNVGASRVDALGVLLALGALGSMARRRARA